MKRLLLLAVAALACRGSSSAPSPTRPPVVFSPDVPAWRGGCFSDGPAGKIVNGEPSHDVRVYGAPCNAAGAKGGLLYLDAYDPIAGTGDVTALSSAQGARPVVVAHAGGTGGIVPGDTGARLDASGTRLLTLRDVVFVTGELVLVDLAGAAPVVSAIAPNVRVLNYAFLPGGEILYVGEYDATAREGNLYLWIAGKVSLLAPGISRAEFDMFRLDPTRRRAAYLKAWTSTGGGDLQVAAVSPPGAAELVERGVERMEWTPGGALVWGVRQPNGTVTLRRSASGSATDAQTLAADVRSWSVVGEVVSYVSGWSVLAGTGAFGAASGTASQVDLGAGVLPDFGAAPASGGAVALAWVEVASPAAEEERRSGSLRVGTPLGAGPAVDDRVAPRAGFSFSPSGDRVAYARDWRDPGASGSASPQPGIAGEIRVVPLAGGTPIAIAASGSMQRIAWDPLGSLVAAVAAYDPPSNSGRLEVRRAVDGALLHSFERSSPFGFAFGDDGRQLAVLQGWDDALQRGDLVLQEVGGATAPALVSRDATAFLVPSGGRMIYAVRGGGRDGLWLH